MHFVYILRCADGTLYVGRTGDLAARLEVHNSGTGSTYTARRRPVRMIYAEEYATLAAATARERQLKRWTRRKKEALASGDMATISQKRRKEDPRTAPRSSPVG